MPSSKPASLKSRLPQFFLAAQKPLVMGVLNLTPDSFYAVSRVPSAEEAVARARQLVEEGADCLDIGGQSTRPGSDPVSEAEELGRVLPVFKALAGKIRIPLSIDTDKASVASACRRAGAAALNDVSGLRNDPDMVKEALGFDAVIVMHRGGLSPKTMQENPRYDDVVGEVKEFFLERRRAFERAGGDRARLLFDPGIGFGKSLGHNLSLIKHVSTFAPLGPVVLGASRKSFLGRINPDSGPEDRLEGSLVAAFWTSLEGVRILRVHDVGATARALRVLAAIKTAD